MTGVTGAVGAWVAGAGAGLGVAVPLGAVGVLLLEEGRRGRAAAVSAACAVAFVDMVYAALATALGVRLAPVLAGWEGWARAVSAAVLMVVALRGLLGLRRMPVTAGAGEAGRGVGEGAAPAGGPARTFLRFAGLTAVNPTTALYFAAFVTGGGGPGGGPGGGLTSGFGAVAFVAGVLLASLTWQQLLAAVGVSLGSRLSPRARRLTYCAGYGLVAYYALCMAWPR
ncbi:lysine transporter LysE [Kitasatospora sp. NPDC047058]|uniref:lysine transporter LysE n=1 Tax=Kitasatospora sp. NPDC047058 TaxID=3155620 RepID=UPI003410C439